MRTRLLRPEFWSDARMADLDEGTRLAYMGLWCLADDDGYLDWDLRSMAADLDRYTAPRARENRLAKRLATLVAAGRVVVLECGRHGLVPTLPEYRVKGGNQSTRTHQVHTRECGVRTGTYRYVSVSGTVSGTGTASDTVSESPDSDSDSEFRSQVPPPPGYVERKH